MKKNETKPKLTSKKSRHIRNLLTLVLCAVMLLGQMTAYAAGVWTENEEVLNKDAAAKSASIAQDVPPVPTEYNHAANASRVTFLVQKLDYNGNGYNGDMNTDYYLSYSVDKTGADNTVFISLVDKKAGAVLETKQVTPGQTIQFDQLKTDKYVYTIQYLAGNQLRVVNGQGGGDTDTVVYDLVTSRTGGGFNELGIDVPTLKAQHVTRYVTIDEPPVELAKYTLTGDVATNKFIAAGKAEFKGYEYVAEKAPDPESTRGYVAAGYKAGTALLQYGKNYKQATVRYITKDDGTARVLAFIINPDHPNFKDYYLKDAITVDDLKLNEIMAVVNKPNRTQEDVKRLNSPEFPFLLMFVSEELAPGQYNEGNDALGRPDPWVYETSKNWAVPQSNQGGQIVPGYNTKLITHTLGLYNGHKKGNLYSEAQHYLVNENGKYLDLEGNVVAKETVIIGGLIQSLVNRTKTIDAETVYYYRALKGSVVVNYEDTAGVVIAPKVTDIADAPHNTAYDTEIDNKPLTIVANDSTYRYKEVKNDSAATIGKVVGGKELNVTYVYDLIPGDVGDVIVHYVDTQGNVIKPPVFDEENTDENSPYDTTDKREKEITFNGKTYRYKEIQNGSDPEKGNIVGGTSKNVTYVYELVPEKGSVKVNYVDEQGNVIKLPVFDEENADAGTAYDTVADNKPKTIKTADGKEYELVRVHKDSAAEQGKIVGGKTLEVTYVYKLKNGNQNNDPGYKAAPKTGDVNNFFLQIGLLAFASVGLVFVLKKRVQR
ncbi:MAG: MucBP domain-containing protein [Eubacteriales bacterium]|nr:MucBP domain-containing protein [Eubacteriales bacterium]